MWLTYALGVGLLHIVLLSIPFFSVPVAWTLTNVIHNLGMYVFLHAVKGTPFETPDQGKARLLTHWEQLDYGVQFTSSRKFFTISPIILYFLASFYTKYDTTHFILNTASLLSVLIPKMPQLHGVRIFGINKYWNVLKWNKKFYSYQVFCKEGVVSKLHNVKWEVATLEGQLLVRHRLFWSADSSRKMPLFNAPGIFLKRGFMGRLGRPSL